MLDAEGRRAWPPAGEPSPVLLLVSSKSCDACEAARPAWAEAALVAQDAGVRVLELVLDTTPDALEGAELPYPRLAAGDDAWSLSRRIPGVPAAILVDVDGTVSRAFYGGAHRGLTEALVALVER